jgi:transcriptional regulator of acetoin/glycerol metabolism
MADRVDEANHKNGGIPPEDPDRCAARRSRMSIPHGAMNRARQARTDLRRAGEVPAGVLPSIIEKSWQRCLAYGLDGDSGSEYDVLGFDLLTDHREKNHQLLHHALPVIESLFEQIVDTQNMVVLTNHSGCILHACGDAEFLAQAQRVALMPGVEWSESSKGTNAIGTALAEGAPVVVHAEQHYVTANRFLTCSASPIVDPHGHLTGALDVTGDHRGFNRHTMALVRMSVQMIENNMFSSAFRDMLILRFHARPEFIGTLCQGMVAFTEDGTLISANRNACFQLGEDIEHLRGRGFPALFGMPITRLYDHLMVRPHDPIALSLSNGVRVLARADCDMRPRRAARMAMDSPPAASPLLRPAAPERSDARPCGLTRLQTGDPQIDAVVEKVRKVVGRDIPILIQGETGTGKELLAKAVHCAGPRADKPFVAVNCAAIPEGLIESELFGYEEGAFTGARRKGNAGRIQLAEGGTLFLDEIGDMPLSLQARLLRVLQERVVTPLGSLKSCPVNIAVICATHRRIRELVGEGRFREDLYFRLNGLTVTLPPLRVRGDLDTLIAQILSEIGGDRSLHLDDEVAELFHRHPWPGNVRQLANLLRTAVVMADEEGVIRREHLPDDFIEDIGEERFSAGTAAPTADLPADRRGGGTEPGGSRLQDLALQAIHDAVTHHGGNISAAARELGISRSTLYRKLQGH